jgi:hypothetical protein
MFGRGGRAVHGASDVSDLQACNQCLCGVWVRSQLTALDKLHRIKKDFRRGSSRVFWGKTPSRGQSLPLIFWKSRDAQVTWMIYQHPVTAAIFTNESRWDDKPRSSVCTHLEHQARTINILQSLCVSHKIVETYRNQHAFRSRDERKRAEKMWNMKYEIWMNNTMTGEWSPTEWHW